MRSRQLVEFAARPLAAGRPQLAAVGRRAAVMARGPNLNCCATAVIA